MSTPIQTTNRRWHRSTFVVAGLALLVFTFLNLGGDYRGWEYRITHGWPWVYGERKVEPYESIDPSSLTAFWFRLERCDKMFPIVLLADFILICFATLAISLLWEWRRRRLQHCLQFTLADWLVGCAVIPGIYVACIPLGDSAAEEQLFSVTAKLGLQINLSRNEVSDLRGGYCGDYLNYVPYAWFWDMIHLPANYRPHQLRSLPIRVGYGSLSEPSTKPVPDFIPDAFPACLANFRRAELLTIRITHTDRFSNTGWKSLQALQNVRELKIEASELADEEVREFPVFSKLVTLQLNKTKLTDQGLMHVASGPRIESLELISTKNVWGHHLSKITSLRELKLNKVPLDGWSLAQLASLKRLRRLELTDIGRIVPTDWQALAKSESLEELQIHDLAFNDDGLRAISHCPKLKSLLLESASISDEGVRCLGQFPALEQIDLRRCDRLTTKCVETLRELKLEHRVKLSSPSKQDDQGDPLKLSSPSEQDDPFR